MRRLAGGALGAALGILGAVGAAGPARAVEYTYILPSAEGSAGESGMTLTVVPAPRRAAAGEGAWYYERALGAQFNRDQLPASPGARWTPLSGRSAGLIVVGLDESAERRTVARAELVPLAAAAGLSLADRPEFVVRELRSAKSLVRPEPGAGSEVAFSKTGQRAEVRPLADPTVAPIGSVVPFVVYVDGINTKGVEIVARHGDSDATVSLVSGDPARTWLRVTAPGVWRLSFARLAPASEAGADFDLYAGTLAFTAGGQEVTP